MPGQTASDDLGNLRIRQRSRSQRVKAKHPARLRVADGDKGFCSAPLVILSRVTAQEVVECLVAAVECLAIMLATDRLLMPGEASCVLHRSRGSDRAAAKSRAFGFGGCSSKSRTRRLSLADSLTSSDCSIT